MLWKRLKKEVIIYSIKVIFLSTLKKGQIFASPFRNCKGRSGKKSSFSAIREERKKILLKEEFFNATKERRGGRGGDRRWRSWEGGCSRQGEKAGEATPPLPPSELSNSQNKIGFHGEATPPSSSWGAIVHLQNSRYFEFWKALPFPKSLSRQLIRIWQISTTQRKKTHYWEKAKKHILRSRSYQWKINFVIEKIEEGRLFTWKLPWKGMSRSGICQILYTRKIPKIFNFTQEKRIHCDIFGQKLRMDDVLNKLSVCCNHLLKYKLTPVVLWKF